MRIGIFTVLPREFCLCKVRVYILTFCLSYCLSACLSVGMYVRGFLAMDTMTFKGISRSKQNLVGVFYV